MYRLPSESHRVSVGHLLHKTIETCEQELASKETEGDHPLARKRQFARSLRSVSIRIARFLVLYRCHLATESLSCSRFAVAYLGLSQRATAALWDVLEDLRQRNRRVKSSSGKNAMELKSAGDFVSELAVIRSWSVPSGCQVVIHGGKYVQMKCAALNYSIVLDASHGVNVKRVRMGSVGLGVKREAIGRLVAGLKSVVSQMRWDTFVVLHRLMKRMREMLVLREFVECVELHRGFFRVGVHVRDGQLFLVYDAFNMVFLVACSYGCLHVRSHVPWIGYSRVMMEVTEESVLDCLNDLKRVIIDRQMGILALCAEKAFGEFSLVAWRVVDDALVVFLEDMEVVKVALDFATGRYACESEWDVSELDRLLNDGDFEMCRTSFRRLIAEIISASASVKVTQEDLRYLSQSCLSHLLSCDNREELLSFMRSKKEEELLSWVVDVMLRKKSISCQQVSNRLTMFLEPFSCCMLKVKLPHYWCLFVGQTSDRFETLGSMKIVSTYWPLRFPDFIHSLTEQLSTYASVLYQAKSSMNLIAGTACSLSDTECLVKLPQANASHFIVGMQSLVSQGDNTYKCALEVPSVVMKPFRINSLARSHFQHSLRANTIRYSFGAFLMGMWYPLSRFISLFTEGKNPWLIVITSGDQAFSLLYKNCSVNVAFEAPNHFQFLIPPFGRSKLLHIPLSNFKQCLRQPMAKSTAASNVLKPTYARFDFSMLKEVKKQVETFFAEKTELQNLGFSQWALDDQGATSTSTFSNGVSPDGMKIAASLTASGISVRITSDQNDPVTNAVREILRMVIESRESKLKITSFVISLLKRNLQVGRVFLTELCDILNSDGGDRVNWPRCLETAAIVNDNITFKFLTTFAGDFQITLSPDRNNPHEAIAEIVGSSFLGDKQILKLRQDFRQWISELDVPQFLTEAFDDFG